MIVLADSPPVALRPRLLCEPKPALRADRNVRLRRDLHAIVADGAACSLMVGIGENYIAPFALALGMGEMVAGLVTSVPLLAGAILQLVAPAGLRWLGSYRRWVVLCVSLQAASFLPLAVAALYQTISVPILFLFAALYWGGGLASSPVWNTWVGTLVPGRIRARYFGGRNRFTQGGVLLGFAGGGLALQAGAAAGRPLLAFAAVFAVAAASRFVSASFLASQSEPLPPVRSEAPDSTAHMFRRVIGSQYAGLLLFLLLVQGTAQIASAYFTPFMLGQLHFSYSTYMLVVATALLAKAVTTPWLGRFAQRFGTRRLLWLGATAVIPLPALWIVSHTVGYLLCLQLFAGTAWAAYELALALTFLEAIDPAHRTDVLTVYNLGYAAMTVAGCMLGGLLMTFGGGGVNGYLVAFAVSTLIRLANVTFFASSGWTRATKAPFQLVTAAGNDQPLSELALLRSNAVLKMPTDEDELHLRKAG